MTGRQDVDTIVAIATPAGYGGIGVIRVSGPKTADIARSLLGLLPAPRQAKHARFLGAQGELLDDGIALYFSAPHSFTGDDVLELQGHGGPVVLNRVLRQCLALGARQARPGEFSERAFLNGKMDLVQAEAVADLISSASDAAAKAALASVTGEFSRRVHKLTESVIQLRAYIEAAIDFTDEEIDFLAASQVNERLITTQSELAELLEHARQGQMLHEGLTVVIAGPPNAGKSSLINQLAGDEVAIVTPIAGTTRDLVRARLVIDGLPVQFVDTAGLRSSDDVVEQEGIRRAQQAMTTASRILLVLDGRDVAADHSLWPTYRDQLPNVPVTVIFNKCDLTNAEPGWECCGQTSVLRLSAHTGAGINLLREHLKECAGYAGEAASPISARRRHVEALQQTQRHLKAARDQHAMGAGELMAEELRSAQHTLGEITGEFTNDDLLGRIFSSFCIGK